MTRESGLAQRKREFVRNELARETLRLLAEQGYEATTVEQVTDAVGVSRRTFFRYFQSKEDVIVQSVTEKEAEMAAVFAARPAGEDTSAALRSTLTPLATRVSDERTLLKLIQLIITTPALHARFLVRQAQWKTDLATVLAQRTGLDPADMRLLLIVSLALATFHAALTRWAESDGAEDLNDLLDQMFSLVAPALNAVP